MKKYLFTFAFCVLLTPLALGMGRTNMVSMLNRLNQGVVNIETTIIYSAYSNVGIGGGTGFLINKEKGIFLTNAHVVSPGSVCRYIVRFSDGKEAKAKLRYYDPWQDFALLEVNPADIPDQTDALKLKPFGVVENEEVFIIGNNGGREYSFLSGRIANRFEKMGYFPNQSFRVTLNNAPGSSGSPVLNMSGEVLGIIHSGNDASSAFALPVEYIQDCLSSIAAGRTPSRKQTGALVEYASLDRAEKFLKLPDTFSAEYLKKYPGSKRKILKVANVLKGSPAEGLLIPGDIIVSVNGKSFGPNLYEMDKLINESTGPLKFDVYRYGQKTTVDVDTYDLQAHKIGRLVIAGGATFYTADDSIRLQTGMDPGSVITTNVQKGGSFYYAPIPPIPDTDKTLLRIDAINTVAIKTLDDVISFFTPIAEETDLNIQYANFGYCYTYSRTYIFNQSSQLCEVTYNPLDGGLMIFEFDESQRDWVKK